MSDPKPVSLHPCVACGAQISTLARTCPQCGHPQPRTDAWVRPLRVVLVLAGLAGAFTLERWVEAGGAQKESERADLAYDRTAEERRASNQRLLSSYSERVAEEDATLSRKAWDLAVEADELRARWLKLKSQRNYGAGACACIAVIAGVLYGLRRRERGLEALRRMADDR